MSDEILSLIYTFSKKFSDPETNLSFDPKNQNISAVLKDGNVNISLLVKGQKEDLYLNIARLLKNNVEQISGILSVNVIINSDVENTKTNNIVTKDTETINYSFMSKKFSKYSRINFSGLYDLKEEINKEYKISYSYFDECFGINIDFNRKSYEEDNLKPQDILTLMFSFKNIGSYKSTNLAVSENDKQDIEWENINNDNKRFEKNSL